MKVFNHINDCWAAISECKTIDEVNDLIQTFPRCMGEWWISTEGGYYVVTNHYYDNQLEDWFEDSEELGIEVEVKQTVDIQREDIKPGQIYYMNNT